MIGNASGHHDIEALDIFMLMSGSRAFTAMHLFLQSPRKFCRFAYNIVVLTATWKPGCPRQCMRPSSHQGISVSADAEAWQE